jgi:carbamoyltransferase
MLRLARHARAITGERRLCLAGGVALNCVANAVILKDAGFDDIWVQPAAGDAGGALGAALAVWHGRFNGARVKTDGDGMRSAYLGPDYSDDEIRRALDDAGAVYEYCEPAALLDATVDALLDGQVVAWFQGRMEYGPRALGNRSILADPRVPGMQSRLNLSIKFRESFRPFAPAVLEQHAADYFDLDRPSPYMLLVAPVHERQRLSPAESSAPLWGMELLNATRSTIPAVTHVDWSARVQTVNDANGRFHHLLTRFNERSGCAVLVNTSMNVRGEPIVCRPAEAFQCLMRTQIEVLAIGNFIVRRAAQDVTVAARYASMSIDPD